MVLTPYDLIAMMLTRMPNKDNWANLSDYNSWCWPKQRPYWPLATVKHQIYQTHVPFTPAICDTDCPEHVFRPMSLTLRFTLSRTNSGASLYWYRLCMCLETIFMLVNMLRIMKITSFVGCTQVSWQFGVQWCILLLLGWYRLARKTNLICLL